MLKRTPLYEIHAAAGGKMVPFAGWEMPVHYGSILDEVRSVRHGAGLFDVSHMGEVRLSGPGALPAVQRLLTNDASRLKPGRAQYSLMCRPDGGILDDLIVYRWDDGADPDFLIVVNASNRVSDFEWMTHHAGRDDVEWRDASDETALIALQGPEAERILTALAPDLDASTLRPFSHADTLLRVGETAFRVHVARTGYTGEEGFEVFCAWNEAPPIWEAMIGAGARPCGLGARDVLRIEASYPLYGHEISTETNPYEAGLGWVVKTDKGDFIGRDAMLSAKEAGLERRLCGILPDDARAIPREGTSVQFTDGPDGRVTSGTFSPTLERAIAMAYVPVGSPESALLPMRGRELPARIVPLPFYKRAKS